MSRILSPDESLALHKKALDLLPKDEVFKSTTYMVGITTPDKAIETLQSEQDFLWIKCHKKILLSKIRDAYMQRFPGDEVTLLTATYALNDLSQPLGELNDFGDNIIVFRALKTTSTRRPLEPTDNHGAVKLESPEDGKMLNGLKKLISPLTTHLAFKTANSPHTDTFSPALQDQSETKERRNRLPQPSLSSPVALNYSAQLRSVKTECSEETTPWRASAKSEYCTSPLHGQITMPYRNTLQDDDEESGQNFDDEQEDDDVDSDQDSRHLVSMRGEDFASSGNAQLKGLFSESSLEILERGVETGLAQLEEFRSRFASQAVPTPDTVQWLKQIETIKAQAVKTRTVVGVVGNTGAGKSSVINAMLDEERLVPTNCMRACTAVVTEISYNESEDPEHKYSAKIEFVSANDWEKELKILFSELIDADGRISRECTNLESEAGIAYAKIRAVYPKKTKDDLAHSSVEGLLNDPTVKNLFGTVKQINSDRPERFYTTLQHYVDSKEKSTSQKKDKKERKDMEFWPLIKVVKLYVKSPALSTGAVIVDLPGVHDSNAARAAVAESYMKQCTGLWIVAPISRAVDDKAAKDLLGNSFKRQLKMDGGYSAVTFICSKTDDISVDEAINSLDLEDELEEFNTQIDACKKEKDRLKVELAELKDTKAVYGEAMNTIDDQLETWQGLKDKIEEGETVFAPDTRPAKKDRKRKRSQKGKQTPKKRKTNHSDEEEDSDFIDDGSDSGSDAGCVSDEDLDVGDGAAGEPREPLTAEDVAAKIKELGATKKEHRRQRTELDQRILDVRGKVKLFQGQEEKIRSKMSALCIDGRNLYAKSAIQKDFAAGIKELDQEQANEDDEENFNPDVELRDYDELARSLPVFCVSSRGYQKLRGRMGNDQFITPFANVDETEIPALRAHCKKLTEAGRRANCMMFLNSLNQLLNSLSLWVSNDGTRANLSNIQIDQGARFINRKLEKLDERLDNVVKKCITDLKNEIGDQVYDKYELAIAKGMESASPTCMQWGLPYDRENPAEGGLHWSTYKAICRRNGVYTNRQGLHDFNGQLAEPMIKVLATGWERVFARGVPTVLSSFARDAARVLRKFHKEVEFRAHINGTGIAGLSMLSQQLQVYESMFKDIVGVCLELITSRQREINREFTPVIAAAMEGGYDACMNENGPGSFARMKARMSTHVHDQKAIMFTKSTNEVRKCLATLLSKVEDVMAKKTDEVFLLVKRDYNAVLGGANGSSQGEHMPKHERVLRKEVNQIIEKYGSVWLDTAGAHNDPNKRDDANTNEVLMAGVENGAPAGDAPDGGDNAGSVNHREG